jgi:hypothetical protein
MKDLNFITIKHISILFLSTMVLLLIFLSRESHAEMSSGMQMGDMRKMMQRMMAGQLLLGLDPALLPNPQSNGAPC